MQQSLDKTYKKIKHGQVPGDMSKYAKAKMLEKPSITWFLFPWQKIRPTAAKAFRNMKRMKERAILKRRTKRMVENEKEA